MDDYYDSVLRQKVPAGPVVVLATVNVGTGPAPEVPDVAGDLRCRPGIEVPAGGEGAVEGSFDGWGRWPRAPPTPADEAHIQASLTLPNGHPPRPATRCPPAPK